MSSPYLLSMIDELGGARTYNHYLVGWMHAMDSGQVEFGDMAHGAASALSALFGQLGAMSGHGDIERSCIDVPARAC